MEASDIHDLVARMSESISLYVGAEMEGMLCVCRLWRIIGNGVYQISCID